MTRPKPRPLKNLKFQVHIKLRNLCLYEGGDDQQKPANVDEDAGVGKDDGEKTERIAGRRNHHQSLSTTNPDHNISVESSVKMKSLTKLLPCHDRPSQETTQKAADGEKGG